jgi:hypothetical protein
MNTPDTPKTPKPAEIPTDNFDEYLEWTPEEEEAFLQVLKDADRGIDDGNT